jgi:multiple sugar transport system substrate-binding protein
MMADLYSRRSFLAGVLAAGTLSTGAVYLTTRTSSITLKLVTGADPTGARDLLISMWHELNPKIRIDVEEIDSSTNDQLEKFLATSADIYNLDIIHIRKFGEDGLLRPIDPEAELSLLDPIRRVCETTDPPGKYWALPFNADVGMLFRRISDKATLDEPPTLKKVVAEAPEQFVGQLETGGTQTDEAFVVNVLEHALAQDEAILPAEGEISYNLGQWRTALQPLTDVIRARRVRRAAGEEETTRIFREEDLRYMRNWPVEFHAVDRSERKSWAPLRSGLERCRPEFLAARERYSGDLITR